MTTDISHRLAADLLHPRSDTEPEPAPEIDVARTVARIELRQRELHAAVLELRSMVEDLQRRWPVSS